MLCTFSEMCRSVKGQFPAEYKRRRTAEKRRRHNLPPLPGNPMSALSLLGNGMRGGRRRGGGLLAGGRGGAAGGNVLAAGAGVCFVVLLMMLGFTVFATTVGFMLWYMVEVSMDLLCDLALEISEFVDLAYQALLLLCIEGRVPTDLSHLISASAGRMLSAFTKLVNRTQTTTSIDSVEDEDGVNMEISATESDDVITGAQNNNTAGQPTPTTPSQFLSRMAQAQVANYMLVGFLVTYILYRFAKHIQGRRLAAAAAAAAQQQAAAAAEVVN